MNSHELPDWYPNHPPLYDIQKSYLENAQKGPFFDGPLPKRELPPKEKWVDFLGVKITSRIDVPAGPLLNARWVSLAASLGFDVLTYKTIRSLEYPAHPVPNMLYLDTHGMVLEKLERKAYVTTAPPPHIDKLAVTNSFGIPSRSSSYLLEDIPKAKSSLIPGQVLIVSIVATPQENCSFLEDFLAVAHLAKEAGAQIVEANFSCPNVDRKEGLLYTSEETVKTLTASLVKALHPVPLIIKVGLFFSPNAMRQKQGSTQRLKERGIFLYPLLTIFDLLKLLFQEKRISEETFTSVNHFLSSP